MRVAAMNEDVLMVEFGAQVASFPGSFLADEMQ